jgi:hypothetical protein
VKGLVHSNVTQQFRADGTLAHFRMEAVLPGNVAANLHVPLRNASAGHCVLLNGREVSATATSQGTHAFVEVQSGVHTVEWCLE